MKNVERITNWRYSSNREILLVYERVPWEFGCAECKIVLHRLVSANAGLKCPVVHTMQGAVYLCQR
jgi:hypothetical protein